MLNLTIHKPVMTIFAHSQAYALASFTGLNSLQETDKLLQHAETDLCQMAPSERCFRPALAVLEDDISKWNGKRDAKQVLLNFTTWHGVRGR